MDGLKDKVVAVTGGGSGIGRAIALRLAKEGAHVVVLGRKEKPLQETVALFPKQISYILTDVCLSDDIAHAIEAITKKYGRLDGLVNNAGVAPVTPIENFTTDVFDRTFALNVRAVLDFIKQALPLLTASKGSVVNVTSGLVNNPMPTNSVYTATKAAVRSITRTLAKELAPVGIRVNCVAPGPVRTPLYDNLGLEGQARKEYEDVVENLIPLGRYGKPEEIAGVVAFLLSADTIYATGTQYAVDGGFGI